jgi:5-methylcytosine-specific restriction endonuclease McrA
MVREWASMRKKTPITPERLAQLKSMPYHDYLKTPEWYRRRAVTLKIAEFKCMLCFSPDELTVHHRTYERLGQERMTDLLVLCRECHELFHRNRRLVRVEVSA